MSRRNLSNRTLILHLILIEGYCVTNCADVVISDQYPYWVVDTDYSSYAVMYGCLKMNNSECVSARSTVWSRRQTLSPRLQSRANTILQMLCINPAAFLLTSQKNGNISNFQSLSTGSTCSARYNIRQ